jgi:chorismate-pyruvate lyase
VEEFYGEPVDVKVLETTQTGDLYNRQILLTLRSTGTVVQFGIVTIDLAVLSPVVRQKIVEGKTPLGRVLIEHNVLRTIEPKAFYRAVPDDLLASHFQGSKDVCYGRVGVITTDGHPTITVLEILASRPIQQVP